MKKRRLLVLMLVSASIFFTSCKKQEKVDPDIVQKGVSTTNGRLVFENEEVFHRAFSFFNETTELKKKKWKRSYDYEPMDDQAEWLAPSEKRRIGISSPDQIGYIPATFQSFLNSHSEMQIGKTIIWISGNNEYIIPDGDEELLAEIQETVKHRRTIKSDKVQINQIQVFVSPTEDGEETEERKALTTPWLDARYQDPFKVGNDQEYKLVHEVFVYQFYFKTVIELHTKFEHKKQKSWKLASEQVRKEMKNVEVHVKTGSSEGSIVLNAGPVTSGDDLVKSMLWEHSSLDYIKITGEMKATVEHHAIKRTYDISGVLWERNF